MSRKVILIVFVLVCAVTAFISSAISLGEANKMNANANANDLEELQHIKNTNIAIMIASSIIIIICVLYFLFRKHPEEIINILDYDYPPGSTRSLSPEQPLQQNISPERNPSESPDTGNTISTLRLNGHDMASQSPPLAPLSANVIRRTPSTASFPVYNASASPRSESSVRPNSVASRSISAPSRPREPLSFFQSPSQYGNSWPYPGRSISDAASSASLPKAHL